MGQYGGFYAFGLNNEYAYSSGPIQLNLGMSVATGGGAGAPDGDGLMYRYYGGARYTRGPYAVGLEYHRINFPSGNISSTHPALRFQYRMPYEYRNLSPRWYYPVSLSVLGGMWYFPADDVSVSAEDVKSTYTGVRISQQVSKILEADLQLGASALGEVDGYMNYMMGLTCVPVDFVFQPYVRGALGSGGGGGVLTGGGAAYSIAVGLRVVDRLEVGIGPWGTFETGVHGTMINANFRTPLRSSFGLIERYRQPFATGGRTKKSIVFGVGSRIQYASGVDNNGLEYNNMGSAFFSAQLPLSKRLRLAGETLWAASGGYGAYAEGLFSLEGDALHAGRVVIGVNGSVLAAGGGGINVGRGTGIAGGLHAKYAFENVGQIALMLRKKSFGLGAYAPWIFGVQFERDFAIFVPQ
jgi:hypothetical protein